MRRGGGRGHEIDRARGGRGGDEEKERERETEGLTDMKSF